MSWTLDNAINDASAARMARILAQRETDPAVRERLETEAEYLARRGLGYRAVFHPELGFFLARGADGAWRVPAAEFDPAEWGHDYTETNAWGTAFTAPHDGAGLAALHGGEAALAAKLDAFFATPETADPSLVGSYGFVIHEMDEARAVRMGMLGLSNQPAHHIPLMYCFAGRHDDAHRIVTEARDRLFVGSELGQGYPGDEDNGEMSAWYLFAVLGLYPLVPASGEAENPGAPYIARVEIDGAEWTSVTVPRAVLATASRLHFVLGDEPRGWAADTRPPSASTVFGVDDPLRDLLATVPGSPADDVGETPIALAPGESIDLPLAEPAPIGMYTVTLAGGARSAGRARRGAAHGRGPARARAARGLRVTAQACGGLVLERSASTGAAAATEATGASEASWAMRVRAASSPSAKVSRVSAVIDGRTRRAMTESSKLAMDTSFGTRTPSSCAAPRPATAMTSLS
jgi:hypothetical protein